MTSRAARMIGIILAATWLTGVSGLARADGASALDGAQLFVTKTCFACHGQDAKTPILPDYPRLAGQNEAYLLRQLKDIKARKRTNGNAPVMEAILFMVNEEEMKVLVKYVSGLDPSR